MSSEKLLAEWFWIDRWDGSSAALLPMECQGVYRAMLTQAWRRGAKLPNDEQAIQRAIRCTAEEWARCWPAVRGYWRVEGENLVNETQVEIYADARARAEAASARGRRAAQASAQVRAQAQLKLVHKHHPPSPSPSPSPSLKPPLPLEPVGEPDPLIDRVKWKREWNELIPRVAAGVDLDPSEVARKVTAFRGQSYVLFDSIPDARLAHSMAALRSWDRSLRGQVEPEPPRPEEPARRLSITERNELMVRGELADKENRN